MKKKNILFYILAFLIPILIMEIVFTILNVGIFSEKSFIISDMQAQYYSLFSYYKNIFNGTESLFYTFNSGLGTSMLSTFTYYLASPLNLILLLFNNIHQGIIILMLLKIGLTGLTMYIYLDNKLKYKRIYTLMFSLCYALMAYNICYCFNIMWLDGVILAPLILLGIDKLINNKPLLFIITLFLAILSNYYIGYMICIFSTIYMFYSLFMKYDFKKDKKIMFKKFIEFALLGILCVLLTTFLLLPGLIELTNSNKEVIFNFDHPFKLIQNILDIMSKTFVGTHYFNNILCKDDVNIYCSLIVFPLLFFYLFNNKISRKEKIGFIIVLLIFIISVSFKITNVLWHGMSIPQGFNHRFSFLFCLYFIYVAYKSFTKIDNIKIKYYIIFYLLYIIMSITVILMANIEYKNYFIYISMGLMLLYLLLLYNLKSNNKDLVVLIFLLVIGELIFNTFSSYRGYSFNYNEAYNEYENSVNNYMNKYENDNDFYRMEKAYSLTMNDSLLLSYSGVSHFLSSANGDVIDFLKNAGLEGNNLNIEYSINSELLDSILGIKYVFTDDKDLKYYNQISKIESYNKRAIKKKNIKYLYENNNSLNIGYMVNNKINDYKYSRLNNYEYQNYIMNLMINDNQKYFEEINVLKENDYYFNKDFAGYVYLYLEFDKDKDDEVALRFNGDVYDTTTKQTTIMKIPYDYNYKISFTIGDKKFDKLKIKAYKFNDDLFKEAINKLKEQQFVIKNIDNTFIEGNIDVLDDGMFFTTIPYEKGWNIYVDGKKVEYKKLLDTFIGFNLSKGKHNIKFNYETPYLKEGIIISLISFIALISYLYLKHKNIDNNKIN